MQPSPQTPLNRPIERSGESAAAAELADAPHSGGPIRDAEARDCRRVSIIEHDESPETTSVAFQDTCNTRHPGAAAGIWHSSGARRGVALDARWLLLRGVRGAGVR
jgi:hypothetical protein